MPRIRDVTDYLRAHGWETTGRWRGGVVWTWHEFDVLVPPSDDLVDTPVRLRELLACVADAEGRSPNAVERDITMPAVDVVSYRIQDRTPGGVALPVGVRAMRAVRDLVAGCARDAADGRVPDAVGTLLNRTLLSPAADERFGVDVYLPVEADAARSLGRLTALQVLHSSTTVAGAANLPDDTVFAEIARQGVAEDVCFALTDLAGQDRRSSFELGFRWSRLGLAGHDAVTVEFPEGLGERVRAGGRRPHQTERPRSAVVEGPVTSLSDDANGDRWRIGIRGVLIVDRVPTGRHRVVPVLLDGPRTYDVALNAHREGSVVRAEGTTTRIGRRQGVDIGTGRFIVTDKTHG